VIHYFGALAAIVAFDVSRLLFSSDSRSPVTEGTISVEQLIIHLIDASLFIVAVLLLDKILKSVGALYAETEMARRRPVSGHIVFLRVVLAVVSISVGVTLLIGESPWKLLTGIGAISAVAIIIFRDTLLSLSAGMQIAASGQISIGDWIEVPAFEADGIVLDMTLHAVHVQNWNKTIVTVPIYKMTETSFKNWRGMSEFGGRLFQRSIVVDMRSVKFCDIHLLERLANIELIQDQVNKEVETIREFRLTLEDDKGEMPPSDVMETRVLNGPYLTNLDLYQAYISAYLKKNESVHGEGPIMVRQLKPITTGGLPVEIYCFLNDVEWVNYEAIQGRLYATFMAALDPFDLRMHHIIGTGQVESELDECAESEAAASKAQDSK
jgi:miniconductance mechanosensitive channel